MRAMFLSLMLATGAVAQTPAISPKLVVQFGHSSPVDAAAWVQGTTNVITADSFDNSVIIWSARYGTIVDRLTLPLLGEAGLFDAQSVRSITISPDGHTARLVMLAFGPIAGDSAAGAQFTYDLDLTSRQFRSVGGMVPVPSAEVEKVVDDAMPVALPAAPDGSATLVRNGRSVMIVPAAVGAKSIRLGGVAKGYFLDAAMSPDGRRLVRIVEYTEDKVVKREANVWDSRTNTATRAFATAKPYDTARWMGTDRYVVGSSEGDVPAVVVDAGSGRKLGVVPRRCMMMPVGVEGRFVAAGPASCGGAVSAEDGLWLFERTNPASKGFTLDRRWQKAVVPAKAAGQIITALNVAPDGEEFGIYAATRPAAPVDGVYPVSSLYVSTKAGAASEFFTWLTAGNLAGAEADDTIVSKLAVSPDRSTILLNFPESVTAIDKAGGGTSGTGVLETWIGDPELLDSDGRTIVVASRVGQALQRYDARTHKRMASLAVTGVLTGGFLGDVPVLWTSSDEGTLRMWDSRGGKALLTYYSFPDNGYFAVMPDGRYDTNLGPDTKSVRWLMPDAPYQSLPSQAFLRSHYEPGLVRKLLDCVEAGCGDVLKPLPDVAGLNRVVPYARIREVTKGPGPYEVTVTVDTTEARNTAVNGKERSGVYDLRLYRDGQLVRQFPDVALPAATSRSTALWRQATAIPEAMRGDLKPFVHQFTVPIGTDGEPIVFSTYSFNEDRIKGFTGTRSYTPEPPVVRRAGRTVIVAIGVDATANPEWRLNYAANDARSMAEALSKVPGRTVQQIVLTSTTAADRATKANIGAVLRHLNGFANDDDRAAAKALDIDPAALAVLTPDDVVILTFSGHGDTIDGEFYMVPSDAKVGADGKPVTASLMSSFELTSWARHVEALDMAMIIDACHSAASVDANGFKPGPMGDPGLGQLAYDKGIRILAATQADNVALEDGKLGHGLLTYALVEDGLKRGQAEDLDDDGNISLYEWLRYGTVRLPVLAAEIAAGRPLVSDSSIAATRGFTPSRAADPARKRPVQEPQLFDFAEEWTRDNVMVRRVGAPR
nr:caspase family protein [Polymorphobacter sp.]